MDFVSSSGRESSAPVSHADSRAMRATSGRGRSHVLVADRDPVATGAIAWLLREQGYPVTSIVDPRRSIDALERARPDLLLVDGDVVSADGEPLLERDQARRAVARRARHRRARRRAASRAMALVLPRGADDCVSKAVSRSRAARRACARSSARERTALAPRTALAAARAELERAREDAASNRQLVDILHEVTGELSATEIYRILARRVARRSRSRTAPSCSRARATRPAP